MPRHTPDPAEHPRTAAEAVRTFNHTTQHPHRITYPGTAYHAISAFTTLAHRLPQSYEQIATALTALCAAGHLTADHDTPTTHTAAAVAALREAQNHANAMAAALERAHTATNPLGYCGPMNNHDDDL
ncbi:hypothetical protein [Streptomyces acidiscabies]|uniref:Uncharacterized protein n=1 Tax=Streptomyces acidiscabies TaxID=42234 RepID=A0ABU4LQK9_9ACTN|nr:hypothetical protein [Streptomyces acidiscabies]MDX3017339.1 hypothetical protein [Streptomyces acidiscabies]